MTMARRQVTVECDDCGTARLCEPGMYGECPECGEEGFTFADVDEYASIEPLAIRTLDTYNRATVEVGFRRLARAVFDEGQTA